MPNKGLSVSAACLLGCTFMATHPSEVAPAGGRLVELVIEHPDADHLRSALSALGANVEVMVGEQFLISAKVETRNGLITIR